MAITRCKFTCVETSMQPSHPDALHGVRFIPVTSGSEENKLYFKYTPGGELKLSGLQAQHFTVGRNYYIDLIEAD